MAVIGHNVIGIIKTIEKNTYLNIYFPLVSCFDVKKHIVLSLKATSNKNVQKVVNKPQYRYHIILFLFKIYHYEELLRDYMFQI